MSGLRECNTKYDEALRSSEPMSMRSLWQEASGISEVCLADQCGDVTGRPGKKRTDQKRCA